MPKGIDFMVLRSKADDDMGKCEQGKDVQARKIYVRDPCWLSHDMRRARRHPCEQNDAKRRLYLFQ